jgi:FLVCR family feline leukemia virus subgroup C receptor-related protein
MEPIMAGQPASPADESAARRTAKLTSDIGGAHNAVDSANQDEQETQQRQPANDKQSEQSSPPPAAESPEADKTKRAEPVYSERPPPNQPALALNNPSNVLGLELESPTNTKRQQLVTQFHEPPPSPSSPDDNQHQKRWTAAGIRPTRKRYFILFMFFILQIVKSFQWICLASITNVVAKFYQVDNLAINWTTILFMVTFLVLALPVSWIMELIGVRRSVLIGAVGVSLGIFIKCFSCHRDGFAIGMWGHLIVGLCEPFFFSSYSQLASIWFPDNQVALATAVSLIGEQTGLALGFIIPPLVIGTDPNDFVAIQRGLFGLFSMVALISIVNTISIVLFFDEEPRLAPGIARYKQKLDETIRRQSLEFELDKKQRRRRSSTISRRLGLSVGEQVKVSAKFLQDKHFVLLLVGFGICEGVSYSIHTLLNQMIVQPASLVELGAPFEAPPAGGTNTTSAGQQQQPVGWLADDEASLVVGHAGLILIMSGLLGSACCGYLLDRYHKHKQSLVLIYLMNLLAMAALTGCLLMESPLALYLATIPLGFSQLGYATCAFDFSVELTYPKPELISSTLLNIAAQIFGIPISLAGSMIVDNLGSLALGGFFCLLLLAGCVVACLQGGELRRQSAVMERNEELANKWTATAATSTTAAALQTTPTAKRLAAIVGREPAVG